MVRWLATLLVVVAAGTASAKVLCPPGRFVISAQEILPAALADGDLMLGTGRVGIVDACRAVRGGQFHTPSQAWLYKVRARWSRCGGKAVSMRAHFDLNDALYCTRLVGTFRVGRRTVPFVADRVPECGNGLREPGEDCDGGPEGDACCDIACRIRNGCFRTCDTVFFKCAADEICTVACGASGRCRPRVDVDCETGLVCGCDHVTVFANACEAYEAGNGVSRLGGCPG